MKDTNVLMKWILFTVFIFGAFASDEEESIDWLDAFDQYDENNVVQMLSQSIQHDGELKEDVAKSIEQKFGIMTLKSQTQQIYNFLYLQKKRKERLKREKSQYEGVYWHRSLGTWIVHFLENGKINYGGLFNNELDAAKKVNQLCVEAGIPPKNPGINAIQNQELQIENTSTCTYIPWQLPKNGRHGRYKIKKYNGRLFDNEKHVAMSVNLNCDECNIERKNSMIDVSINIKKRNRKTNVPDYGEVVHSLQEKITVNNSVVFKN